MSLLASRWPEAIVVEAVRWRNSNDGENQGTHAQAASVVEPRGFWS
jgi:hypothetical protein